MSMKKKEKKPLTTASSTFIVDDWMKDYDDINLKSVEKVSGTLEKKKEAQEHQEAFDSDFLSELQKI